MTLVECLIGLHAQTIPRTFRENDSFGQDLESMLLIYDILSILIIIVTDLARPKPQEKQTHRKHAPQKTTRGKPKTPTNENKTKQQKNTRNCRDWIHQILSPKATYMLARPWNQIVAGKLLSSPLRNPFLWMHISMTFVSRWLLNSYVANKPLEITGSWGCCKLQVFSLLEDCLASNVSKWFPLSDAR